jgi:hypothetical protein
MIAASAPVELDAAGVASAPAEVEAARRQAVLAFGDGASAGATSGAQYACAAIER